MAALHHHRPRPARLQLARRLAHRGAASARAGPAAPRASVEVGREHRGQREQPLSVGALRGRIEQAVAALGHHHRVHHQEGQARAGHRLRHRGDDAAVGEHARLGRGHRHVGGHRVDLRHHHAPAPARRRTSPSTEFCAVTAVMADVPCTPWAANVRRSAWMPAPPPESEPAMVSATFIARRAPRPRRRPHALEQAHEHAVGQSPDHQLLHAQAGEAAASSSWCGYSIVERRVGPSSSSSGSQCRLRTSSLSRAAAARAQPEDEGRDGQVHGPHARHGPHLVERAQELGVAPRGRCPISSSVSRSGGGGAGRRRPARRGRRGTPSAPTRDRPGAPPAG